MIIGVPKEIKAHEHRVGMVPHSVKELVNIGHVVIVQRAAGAGIGVSDYDYISAGAKNLSLRQKCVMAQWLLMIKEVYLEIKHDN